MKFGEWFFVGLCLLWVAWLGLCIYVVVDAYVHYDHMMLTRGLIMGAPSLFVTYLWWDRHYGSVFNRR